jgi:hypothetical protein
MENMTCFEQPKGYFTPFLGTQLDCYQILGLFLYKTSIFKL